MLVFAVAIMLCAVSAGDYLFAGDGTANKAGLGIRYNDGAVVVKNAKRLAVATLWFEIDGGTPTFAGLNDFEALDTVLDDGQYRVTLVYLIAGMEGFSAKNAGLLTISGATGVEITGGRFSGFDESGDAVDFIFYIEKDTGGGSILPVDDTDDPAFFSEMNFDLNHDGVVDQIDLAVALKYFTVSEGDENWDAAKTMDFNNDGIVEIEDFIVLTNNIVFEETIIPGVVSVKASAFVTRLNGNRNDLTITVTEAYSDGSVNEITDTVAINNNAAGSYDVGSYVVYVDTKGNDQIRECYIVTSK